MSLKRNIAANYASQIYSTAIGILILPLYVKYLGAEAYGLIGFFTMLQAWFALLDIGLTQTVGRETARFHGGTTSALIYRRLYRCLSIIFVATALLGGTGLWLFSETIAQHWLKSNSLPLEVVSLAIQIMGISVALRWLGGLFRGVITGSERIVWLSGFNVVFASLRFVAVFVSMSVYGFTPTVFFIHQLAVAVLEVAGLCLMSRRLLPPVSSGAEAIGWSFRPVKRVLRFALMIAFTSSAWTLVTQTDKLVLSGVLPLAEYGYFTLAVMVAGGIMFVSGPVSLAIMPRMTKLYTRGDQESIVAVYRGATRTVSVIAGSVAVVLAVFAEPLLFAWSGDVDLARNAAPILRLYALGNGFLAASAFPYYLQYAMGTLKYHFIGSVLLVAMMIPSMIWAASHYGGIGAGFVWLALNTLFLLFWVAYVHARIQPGLHWPWLLKDVLAIQLGALLPATLFYAAGWQFEGRVSAILFLGFVGFVSLATAFVVSRVVSRKPVLVNEL